MLRRHAPQRFATRSARQANKWFGLLLLVAVGCVPGKVAADHLVLRDLTSLVGVTVTQVDADGVLLVGARRIGWDRLRFGQVAPELQTEFDRQLAEVGLPLYRLRYRLEIGDHQGLAELAASLEPAYRDSDSNTARLIRLAAFRGHLASGRRAAAAVAWLGLKRSTALPIDALESRLPWPQRSPDGLWSPELPPIWFDSEEAAAALDDAIAQVAANPTPHAVDRLLLASLAIAAGRPAVAMEQVAAIPQVTAAEEDWIAVLRVQDDRVSLRQSSAFDELRQRLDAIDVRVRPLALYELGRAQLATPGPTGIRSGLLTLLQVPAEHPQAAADLIGAALYSAAEALLASDRSNSARRLQQELRERHAPSWHARFAAFPN